MERFDLTVWTFKKGKESKKVSATFSMTEAEARAAAARKGWDVTGWNAKMHTDKVGVADGDGKLYHYTVTFERTQILTIKVEAEDEEQANEFARKERDESSSYDWESDDDGDIIETEKGDPVDDDDDDDEEATG